jgi:hypothetical protein
MRLLEIGCGNLRAGHLFIDYLESGNYHGIDISPPILTAALQTVSDGLQAKVPHLHPRSRLRLTHSRARPWPDEVVHAEAG